jgi:hypothetical protein
MGSRVEMEHVMNQQKTAHRVNKIVGIVQQQGTAEMIYVNHQNEKHVVHVQTIVVCVHPVEMERVMDQKPLHHAQMIVGVIVEIKCVMDEKPLYHAQMIVGVIVEIKRVMDEKPLYHAQMIVGVIVEIKRVMDQKTAHRVKMIVEVVYVLHLQKYVTV